jgi:hypothetical protein
MRVVVDQYLGARGGVDVDGGLIRHCPGREEQRSGLPEQLCDALFEAPRRWIAIEVVVANLRGREGGTHGSGGASDRVTAEIDRHGAECRAGGPASEGTF